MCMLGRCRSPSYQKASQNTVNCVVLYSCATKKLQFKWVFSLPATQNPVICVVLYIGATKKVKFAWVFGVPATQNPVKYGVLYTDATKTTQTTIQNKKNQKKTATAGRWSSAQPSATQRNPAVPSGTPSACNYLSGNPWY